VRWAIIAAALALGACSIQPRDGQFTCASGECPHGFTCVAAICVLPSDGSVADSALPDAGDASTMDSGTVDSGTVDSGAVDSGSVDTGVDAGPPGCDADFCANFDRATRVDEGWTIAEVLGTGMATLADVGDAPSLPTVFRSSTSVPPPAAGYHAARLILTRGMLEGYETSTPRLRFSFMFRVTEFVDSPGITIGALAYGTETGSGSGPVNLVLSLSPNAARTGIELTYFYAPDFSAGVLTRAPVVLNTWTRIEIVIAPRSGLLGQSIPPGITVYVNDVPGTLMSAPLAVLAQDLRFDLGLATTGPDSQAVTAEYDDVRIDYRPVP